MLSLFGPAKNESYHIDVVEPFNCDINNQNCGEKETDDKEHRNERVGIINTESSSTRGHASSNYIFDEVRPFESSADAFSPDNGPLGKRSFKNSENETGNLRDTHTYGGVSICPPHVVPSDLDNGLPSDK